MFEIWGSEHTSNAIIIWFIQNYWYVLVINEKKEGV